ncbi:PREDICTED: P2Y purinoceptor 11-like [Chaetura pelagica]|uniref:P2Y purinoceptor 11-like n=1 Tax=Chaetura pelagica TaxID=8897 RepID=UPI000523783F|nr:PREDICTED: P2Y purinoceptor 11-like [Chaetura pelagica]
MAPPCGNFSTFQESLWPILAAQFPPALLANGWALSHLLTRRRSWHGGSIFSFHLLLTGTFYSLSLPLLVGYYYPPKDWPYGRVLCKLERFFFTSNLYGGIFFVTSISITRFLGVVYPLRSHGRIQTRHVHLLSLGIWVLVLGISAPTLIYSQLEEVGGVRECWGSATPGKLGEFYPYSLSLAGVGCVLPFLINLSCYSLVIRVVFRNPRLDPREKHKVGMLVGTGLVLFAFSYLPYHLFRNLNLGRRLLGAQELDCGVSKVIHSMAQVSKVLVNLNICLQPLLYAALGDKLRSCCRSRRGNGPHQGEVVAQEVYPVAQELLPVAQDQDVVAQELPPVAQELLPMAQELPMVAQELPPVAPVAQELLPVAQELLPVAQELPLVAPRQDDVVAQDHLPVAQEHLPLAQELYPVDQEIHPVAQLPLVAQDPDVVAQELLPVAQEVHSVAQEIHPVSRGGLGVSRDGASTTAPMDSVGWAKTLNHQVQPSKPA